MQPIQKYLLVISNMEEAVMITQAQNQRTWNAARPEGVIGDYNMSVDGLSTILNHKKLDDLERNIIKLKNAHKHNFQAMDGRLERMERSIKRLMMMPFRMQVQSSITEANNTVQSRMKDRIIQWQPESQVRHDLHLNYHYLQIQEIFM
jgi:hypothetical protein